ncbi:ATP-binding cassette domain-containing protein [Guyparkeria sp. SB14A]|uniref:molybdenum ABC transporter ATP-binding protein n=1 Tax=Guyparkeria sp. SB14A TaxID=2571147 RepID=UPI0010AC98EA|nr:ATP-binding cassette domain-containing protein [Guyparkeria sp. SB14A]TKA88345.1 ATP-binding cassette domain-containing protein [Guyparkeria sp. SB14A]
MFAGNLTLTVGEFRMASGDFAFDSDGVTALFGRSGSGKSTLLRAMAGLDRQTRGQLRFHDETWQDGRHALPAEQRDIGMVFQHAALLAHRTVRGNLDFAARRAPADRGAAIDRDQIIERTGLGPLLDRAVGKLSGGERQRIAIARALIGKPRVLMMDEPLAALDWRAKAELLDLFETVIRDFGIPTVIITHAPAEVERLADRVVFMSEGRVERVETLKEALGRVDSPLFTEEGPVASLDGHVEHVDGDPHRLRFVTTPQTGTGQPVTFQLGADGSTTEHGPRLCACAPTTWHWPGSDSTTSRCRTSSRPGSNGSTPAPRAAGPCSSPWRTVSGWSARSPTAPWPTWGWMPARP